MEEINGIRLFESLDEIKMSYESREKMGRMFKVLTVFLIVLTVAFMVVAGTRLYSSEESLWLGICVVTALFSLAFSVLALRSAMGLSALAPIDKVDEEGLERIRASSVALGEVIEQIESQRRKVTVQEARLISGRYRDAIGPRTG